MLFRIKFVLAMALLFAGLAAHCFARREIVSVDLARRASSVSWTWTADADSAVQMNVMLNGDEFDLSEWGAFLFVGDDSLAADIPGRVVRFNQLAFDVTREYLPTNGRYAVQVMATNATGRVEEWARGSVTVRANPSAESMPHTWNGYENLASNVAPYVLAKAATSNQLAEAASATLAAAKAYADTIGGVSPSAVTNAAEFVVSEAVRTNWVSTVSFASAAAAAAVSEAVRTNWLCTVAAAAAMSNNLETAARLMTNATLTAANAYADYVGTCLDERIDERAIKATTLAGYGITDAYTKDEVTARTEWYVNVPVGINNPKTWTPVVLFDEEANTARVEFVDWKCFYLKSEVDAKTNAVITAELPAFFEEKADYVLTNATGAAATVRSGEIASLAISADTRITLDFSEAADKSGDCLMYVVNATANEYDLMPTQTNGYAFVSADLAEALTIGAATSNVVMFTRLKSDTVLVSKMEVK